MISLNGDPEGDPPMCADGHDEEPMEWDGFKNRWYCIDCGEDYW